LRFAPTGRLSVGHYSCSRVRLTGQLVERNALADNTGNGYAEALPIGHRAIVEAIGLLVEITEQVERLD
jgi:hypothetical protein